MRQRGRMALAAHAEAYVQHVQSNRIDTQDSISHREYDVEGSRKEWENSIQ